MASAAAPATRPWTYRSGLAAVARWSNATCWALASVLIGANVLPPSAECRSWYVHGWSEFGANDIQTSPALTALGTMLTLRTQCGSWGQAALPSVQVAPPSVLK